MTEPLFEMQSQPPQWAQPPVPAQAAPLPAASGSAAEPAFDAGPQWAQSPASAPRLPASWVQEGQEIAQQASTVAPVVETSAVGEPVVEAPAFAEDFWSTPESRFFRPLRTLTPKEIAEVTLRLAVNEKHFLALAGGEGEAFENLSEEALVGMLNYAAFVETTCVHDIAGYHAWALSAGTGPYLQSVFQYASLVGEASGSGVK